MLRAAADEIHMDAPSRKLAARTGVLGRDPRPTMLRDRPASERPRRKAEPMAPAGNNVRGWSPARSPGKTIWPDVNRMYQTTDNSSGTLPMPHGLFLRSEGRFHSGLPARRE